MQRGGSSASFYPCLLLSMPLPTRASCYPCLPRSFPPTTLHRASPRAPQGEAAGCWPSLQGVGVKAVWLPEEGNASWASPRHHLPCTPMVLLARMRAPALSTLLAPSRSAPSDGQAEAAQCQAWITGGVSKMPASQPWISVWTLPCSPLPEASCSKPPGQLLTQAARAQALEPWLRAPAARAPKHRLQAPKQRDGSGQRSGTMQLQTRQTSFPDESAKLNRFTLLLARSAARSPVGNR